MIFCSNCFKDTQIRSMIIGANKIGNKTNRLKDRCPICGNRNGVGYNTDSDFSLKDFFNDLINIYTPQKLFPANYDPSELHMLADELKNNWNIFSDSVESREIYSIVKVLSSSLYSSSPELFDSPIGIPEKYDEKYLEYHSILKGKRWNGFVDSIKYSNRFHTNIINHDKLSTYLSYLRKDYTKGSVMYRGRICYNDDEFTTENMGAPPKDKTTEGRANASGISRLYLGDTENTCIKEIRPGPFDIISIGKFVLKEDISVIDFKQINSISPFVEEFDFLEYLINKPILKKIDEEMSKAVRSSDNHLDYIPTQYLCDFIQTLEYELGKKYSGVEYSSTLNKNGFNIAIFYPELFECTEITQYAINKIDYDFS